MCVCGLSLVLNCFCFSFRLPPQQLDPNILRILKGISSPDSLTARASINELADILESPTKQAVLRDYEEIYIKFDTIERNGNEPMSNLLQRLWKLFVGFLGATEHPPNKSLTSFHNLSLPLKKMSFP